MKNPMSPTPSSVKERLGWILFDFANSSYTTVIITAVYAVVFPRFIAGETKWGNLLWSLALSMALLLTAFTAPVLGAMSDLRPYKKRFLTSSVLVCAVATALLFFARPGEPQALPLAFGLLVVSYWAYSLGENFISAFLPSLESKEGMGRLSGLAWGIGYVGGLASTLLVLGLTLPHTLSHSLGIQLIGPLTALFFLVGAIPSFLWLREAKPKTNGGGGSDRAVMVETFHHLATTFRHFKSHRPLMQFLASYFFAFGGLSIVISFTFIYGDQVIHWKSGVQALMFAISNIAAAIGAITAGSLQRKWGDLRVYRLSLLVWVLAVGLIVAAPGLTLWLHRVFHLRIEVWQIFLGVGATAGFCLGATQAVARAVVGLYAGTKRPGEYYGFWAFTGKMAAVLGLLAIGALQWVFGLAGSIAICGLFFLVAWFVSWGVPEPRDSANALGSPGK